MLRILSSKTTRTALASGVLPLLAAAAAALAAWLAQGSVIYSGSDATRVALLSLSPSAIIIATLVGAGVYWAIRAGASPVPVWLLGLIVLAWMPGPLPPAFAL